MEEQKNKIGKPRIFSNPEELEICIDQYREYLDRSGKPPTMAGLAYYTGIDRTSLYNYANRPEYFNTLKAFRDWILMRWEETGIENSSSSLIFMMKNYGYTDRVETENINHNTYTFEKTLKDLIEE